MTELPDLNQGNSCGHSDSGATCGVAIKTKSRSNVSEDLRTFNPEQAHLFYYIRGRALKKAGVNVDPFHVLTGGTGTGKSNRVRCIQAEVETTLQPT